MKKALLAFLAVCAASAGVDAKTHRIDVGEFNELILNDNINVVYSANPDSAGYIVFDALAEHASYIMAERSKGRLKIQLDPAAAELDALPTVYAYSSFLQKAENTKDSTLHIKTISPGAKIELKLEGNGKIIADNLNAVNIGLKLITGKGTVIATGKCDNLDISNVGTGIIQADGITAKHVRCNLMGTGVIGCTPQQTLSLRGLGSGKVYYTGNPQISKSKLSTVKTIRLESGTTGNADENPAAQTEEPASEVTEEAAPELTDLIEMPEAVPAGGNEPAKERKPVQRTESANLQEI